MRAVVYDRYGPPDVLRIEDVEPPIPKQDEILVTVHATTVNRTDCAIRGGEDFITRLGYSIVTTGNPFAALRRPTQRILGTELAGEVAAVGAAVSQFKVGDRVFGVNAGHFGAHAEYVCMRERAPLAQMPTNMTFEEAAAVCDGAILALGCLRRVGLRQGQKILIYGASGSIGTAGVQLAKLSFDAHVTAVCGTKNVALIQSLGADEVIDYTQEDFTKNGHLYDVIFDAVGKHSFRRCRSSLAQGGKYIPTDGWANVFWVAWTARIGDKRVVSDVPPHYRQQDIRFLKELIEAGKYRAVIDRCYPWEQVIEATTYVETQQKVGNVVLTVSQVSDTSGS
ncbi:MAG: Zinc-type alcohol dehydrogenase-like protein [Ktedonobacterales bacterium]|jgi:NADPH:quinone reductase-like Zn-dependent oxidoreductase|nr:MAG: Zinc-type alcohol dehydrogenase-like protein [Ktedonobacterales bacterium]